MIGLASMTAGVPADILSEFAEAPTAIDVPSSDDTPTEDAPGPVIEAEPAPATEEPLSDGRSEGAEDTDAPPDAAPPEGVNPPTDTPAAEELPEGIIKTKDSKGKYKYQLDENRYKTVYGNHQLAQQVTELLGEPVTVEAIDLRNKAYMAQEKLFSDLTSGDPQSQGELLDFMLNEMKTAHETGETGVDPTVPFAETVYLTLRDKAPDAYAHLRFQAARDLIGEMYEAAARTGDTNLFSGAQHFAVQLAGIGPKPADMSAEDYAAHVREVSSRAGIPFYTIHEMQGMAKGEDPLVAAQRRIQELESKVNGPQANRVAEQFTDWNRQHVAAVNTAVLDEGVKPALASAESAWKNFPDDYKRLVFDPLNREVTQIVKNDQALNQQVSTLLSRAKRATSEGVRQQIGEQIQQLYVNRAKLAAEKVKGPILEFAAKALQGRSAQTHERKASAQNRTAPQGQGTPVKQSVLPDTIGFKNGIYDSATAMKQAAAILGR